MSITISGGNGSGAVLKPVVTKRQREIEFDARLKTVQGGVDHINDLIEFKRPHNLQNGEPLVYHNNGNLSLGIGTYLGANTAQNKTLINGVKHRDGSESVYDHDSFGNIIEKIKYPKKS